MSVTAKLPNLNHCQYFLIYGSNGTDNILKTIKLQYANKNDDIIRIKLCLNTCINVQEAVVMENGCLGVEMVVCVDP